MEARGDDWKAFRKDAAVGTCVGAPRGLSQ